ncbi:GroES-like protein [Lipomyces japonicus]|uniref:GroES-like protein n=1 Tax=Lipomyces japonicus TaxID=56871 RepID=UPI0034CF8126
MQPSGNWGRPYAPVAVGHEIIGKIVKIGGSAKPGLKLGDHVGLGAYVGTYFGTYKDSEVDTIDGNASHVRVNSKFAFKIPDKLETIHAAPLLCSIGHMVILFANALGAEVTAISRNHAKQEVAKELGADHYSDDEDFLVFTTSPPVSEQMVVAPFTLPGDPDEIEYMLKFAAEHDIKPWVETIDISEDNLGRAWKRAQDIKLNLAITLLQVCLILCSCN